MFETFHTFVQCSASCYIQLKISHVSFHVMLLKFYLTMITFLCQFNAALGSSSCPLMLSWPESMNRGSSSDLVQNVCRCMRGAQPFIQASSFAGASQDEICEKYHEMIVDILYCCSKPYKGLLQNAAEKAYPDLLSKDECLQLAERLMAAISSCREKAKSMTTGKKLPDSVRNICSFF